MSNDRSVTLDQMFAERQQDLRLLSTAELVLTLQARWHILKGAAAGRISADVLDEIHSSMNFCLKQILRNGGQLEEPT